MRTDSTESSGTFIGAARRAQIIDAAIEVVNEMGYVGTSLARIAAQASTSKSVVSYHFDGKEELMRCVVQHVFEDTGSAMAEAVEAEHTWTGRLEAYVRTELREVAAHPRRYAAATEILISHRDKDGKPFMLSSDVADLAYLESILNQGRDAGAFEFIDTSVTAVTISHAIDGAITAIQRDPDTDLVEYAGALVPLLLAAVGAHGE